MYLNLIPNRILNSLYLDFSNSSFEFSSTILYPANLNIVRPAENISLFYKLISNLSFGLKCLYYFSGLKYYSVRLID